MSELPDVNFADKLNVLVAMQAAKNTPEDLAELLERLAYSLGFAVSIMAAGDRAIMETLLVGAENHMTETAADLAGFGEFMKAGRKAGVVEG